MAGSLVHNFSYVFLLELLAYGLATIIFLFYFNRIFASIVSKLLRAYTWHRYQVYIDFQALQFSPLGGRIFFKGLRYHGQNETILVNRGFITWKYWLRRVQSAEANDRRPIRDASPNGTNYSSDSAQGRSASGAEQGGRKAPQPLPCRVVIEAQGLEWFVYNRSSAYDTILASMSKSTGNAEGSAVIDPENVHRADHMPEKVGISSKSPVSSSDGKSELLNGIGDNMHNEKVDHLPDHAKRGPYPPVPGRDIISTRNIQPVQLPGYLGIFPIGIECSRGAIVMGNEHTRSVLVAKFDKGSGKIDARNSSPLDQYRQCFDFKIVHPVVQLKPNEEYKENQLASGTKLRRAKEETLLRTQRSHTLFNLRRMKHNTMHALGVLVPYFRRSVESIYPDSPKGHRHHTSSSTTEADPGQDRWLGLSRYLDDELDGQAEQERWKAIEYGVSTTIIDSPSVDISFFWDIPGPVLPASAISAYLRRGFSKDINGSRPPAWGIDLKIKGGVVNYGPWADRQRTDLQAMFFPPLHADSTKAKALRPGFTRVSTIFQVVVELEEEITLRIPTREASKDWKWKSQAKVQPGHDGKRGGKKPASKRKKPEKSASNPEGRPPGWLSLFLSRDSCIAYSMDMVASEKGYSNKLDLDLKSPEMSSSVNHGILWRSRTQTISCDLSNPFEWNSLRNWSFDIHSEGLELFILRDHVYLLIDLISDWTSGPLGEFNTFVPFNYRLRLVLPNFKIHLNVNDSNIINNPSDTSDNTLIAVWGQQLTTNICIPLTEYRPMKSKVSFDVDAYHGGFKLYTPTWNTQHTFLDDQDIATLKDLKIDGYYNYCTATAPGLTDTAVVNVHGVAPTIHLYGFLVRYFIKFKDNYFGEDLHFQTLEEYQRRINTPGAHDNAQHADDSHIGLSNDLDVLVSVTADNACLMLPANLYSANKNIKIDLSSITLDLRFTNYYMDLEASFSPLAVSQAVPGDPQTFTTAKDSSTQVFVDGIVVSGHRLFGLPPTEPTYVCNWNFEVGQVTGESSIEVLSTFVSALRCLAFSFGDSENALPPFNPLILHDVTFLRAKIEPIRIWIHVEDVAFLFSTGVMRVEFNDWAGALFSDRLHLSLPDLLIACVDAKSASRHRTRLQQEVMTLAFIQTSVDLRMIGRDTDFEKDRQLQQDHIRLEDTRTARTTWLIRDLGHSLAMGQLGQRTKVRPAAMPYPPMPEPVKITVDKEAAGPTGTVAAPTINFPKPATSRKSSFLSMRSIQLTSGGLTVPPRRSIAVPRVGSDSSGPLPPISDTDRSKSMSQTSRRSSARSGSELRGLLRDGLPPTSVTFSSSYEVPYFPLHFVEPDTRDVPVLPDIARRYPDITLNLPANDDTGQPSEPGNAQTTFIVRLGSGIRILCTPEALRSANSFIKSLQAKDPASVLDEVQIAAMTDVQNEKLVQASQKSIQLRLEVPYAGIRLKTTGRLAGQGPIMQQSYDLAASHFLLTGRSGSNVSNSQGDTRSTLHCSLERINAAVKCYPAEHPMEEARMCLDIYDATAWLVNDRGLVGDLQLQKLEVVSSNRKAKHLAAIFSNASEVLEDIASRFSRTAREASNNAQFLVHWLATSGEGLADPALLIGAAYVLRSAVDHPRNSDSWKMVSRLRYILQYISPDSKQALSDSLAHTEATLPGDAAEQVVSCFNRWRSWDLEHVRASSLISGIFGPPMPLSEEKQDLILHRLKIGIKVGAIRLLVDPGPEANEISFDRVVIACGDFTTPTASNTHNPAVGTGGLHVEIFCAGSTVSLNWEIFELAEDILSQILQSSVAESNVDVTASPKTPSTAAQPFQVTITIDTSNAIFKSINLSASSRCQRLGGTLLINGGQFQGLNLAALVKADSVISNMSNHTTTLLTVSLQDPRIHISSEVEKAHGDEDHKLWKIAALCGELDFDVQEDLLGMLGVADILLGDEVAYIHTLIARLGHGGSKGQASTTAKPGGMKHIFNAVLALDSYRIGAYILPSLQYSVQGEVVRGSLRPVKGADGKVAIDFDIKTHAHALINHSKGNAHEIAVLTVPPITGHISQVMMDERNVFNISLALEKILLDASAVQGLLLTLSRSEISSFKANLIRDAELLQKHYANVIDISGPEDKPSASLISSVLYEIHLAAAGLEIKGTSGKGTDHSARLSFDLSSASIHVSNKDVKTKQSLLFPEISFKLRSVRIFLERLHERETYPCGEIDFSASFFGTSDVNEDGKEVRSYQVKCDGLEINLYTETASTMVDLLGNLQQKFKTVDLSGEVRTIRARRRLRAKSRIMSQSPELASINSAEETSTDLFSSMYSLEMSNIQVSWRIGDLTPTSPGHEAEDLVLSITKIDLATKKGNAARLMIASFQVQMVPTSQSKRIRSFNSALLPEMIFNVAYLSTPKDRRLAFQAAGKSLDLRLTSHFILPASDLQRSMALASQSLRQVAADWNASLPKSDGETRNILGNKKLSSLLIDADFAGAVVYIQGRKVSDHQNGSFAASRGGRVPQHGRYGQFTQDDATTSTVLRAPGLAWKIEYKDLGADDPSLNAEIKVDASTNILYPTVVPLVLEISSSIKEIVGEPEEVQQSQEEKASPSKFLSEDKLRTADPSAILGDCRLNLGLRICRQEFSLSCQPIARVAATAQFEDIYITMNTVQSADQRFFAVCATITRLQASVQHVYSRESTGSFEVESINLSMMNSKHVSSAKGLSAILRMSPMTMIINAKQLHDFLLFREIWVPMEMRNSKPSSAALATTESQAFAVQRYHEVAASGAFPWNITLSIVKLDIRMDLGQAVGRSAFSISNFWVSSKKTSDWEQNLCLGFDKIGIDSTGRMSGFIELQNLRLRTSIRWTAREDTKVETPLILASLTFDDLRVKVAFDYQPLLIADLLSLEFLMYNVRDEMHSSSDRLVGIVNGDKVQAFCTTASSAQAIALYQALQRLIQEKQSAYESSLRDIEKYLRRNSSAMPLAVREAVKNEGDGNDTLSKTPNQLHTNVVITLKTINLGAYPNTFFDHQIFKMEALDASARFSVTLEEGKVHSGLGMTLGQVRIALSGVAKPSVPKTLGDVTVDEVVASATGSRGGTILKVPRVVANMQTWQTPNSDQIDYIFKSSFEGKVEVGWNYSRISYIRGMWANHSRALAQRLGRPLPPSALQITGGPKPAGEDGDERPPPGEPEKITAVINVPQSKYQYTALQPPIIETPQLRDMGEATPPLEWIGLHRERLPNLTHQIVIVTLLEVAKEVEDAYSKILGSS
ncbi:hypothetical protein MMC30_006690 [Trapelia coarctata]|nr:hypothetical protein [Trapelia coarctata]